MSNTFGEQLRLTTFGESHGPAIGGILDGFPAGFQVDFKEIERQMLRRRPGQSAISTQRQEADQVEFLSGIYDGLTLGTPIGFMIHNTDSRSSDYESLRHAFRPSHADYTYLVKYGHRDHRGGGRSSARETAARVAGGSLVRQWLATEGIQIVAFSSQIGSIKLERIYTDLDLSQVDSNDVRCPDQAAAKQMRQLITEAQASGDTLGGIVTCVIRGVPAGLGEPVFDKLQARLAAAMLSIPAVKGFDYGMGFDGACCTGSKVLDKFSYDVEGNVITLTNYSGGIQGGISNGSDIYFRVAFKPVATVHRAVKTVDDSGHNIELTVGGRHDPCVVPRAIPIVESMAALVIGDSLLLNRLSRL